MNIMVTTIIITISIKLIMEIRTNILNMILLTVIVIRKIRVLLLV